MTRERTPWTRRRCLRAAGTAVGVGVAGCTGSRDGEGDAPEPAERTSSPTTTGTATTTATTEPAATGTPIHTGYETTQVRATTPEGDVLGSVTAAIADTAGLRHTGLSDTDSLPEDRGMLFVWGAAADRTFVMRGMEYGLDMVFADGDGVITRIHHAPAPGPNEDGTDQRYPGHARYVLEVNYGWTTDRNVETGDVLEFDL